MKHTVLIVDDVVDNINVAANILMSNGINIGIAQNGKEAIVFAQNNLPELILLDIMMPGMSGFEVCEQLKKDDKTKHIPIIFLTAKTEKESVVKGFQIGGSDYVTKPFYEEELIARVNTQLQRIESSRIMELELQERITIQTALGKSKKKLDAVINSIPDFIFYKDKKSKYTGCNTTFANFLGTTTEAIVGKSDYDFFEKERAEVFINSDTEVFETKQVFQYQEWLTDNTGNKRFLDTTKAIMRNKDNEVFGIVGISRDLTQVKKSEIKVKKNEQKLNHVLENANEGIFVLQNNNFVFFNTKLTKIADTTKEVLATKYFMDLVHPEDKKEVYEFYQRKKRGEAIGSTTNFRIITLNNETKYVKAYSQLIDWEDSKGILVLLDDITSQHETLQELQESIDKYNLLANNMTDFIWMMDMQMNPLYVSPSCKDFTGYSPLEIYTIKIEQLHTETALKKMRKAIGEAIRIQAKNTDKRQQKYTRLEVEYVKKNGHVFPAEVIGHIVYDKQGKPVGVGGISRDISERKAAEKELKKYRNQLESLVEQRTEALKLSEKNFRTLFDKNIDAIIINEPGGKILEANNTASKMLGYSKEELLKLNTGVFISEQFYPQRENLCSNLRTKESVTFEIENITKTGEIFPVEINSTLIEYYGKQVVLSTGRDISERILAEKIKLDTIIATEEKERSRFAKDLHDGLGATLSAVKMYLNIVKRSNADPERANKMLNEAITLIDKAGKNAKEIAVNIRPHDLAHFGIKTSLENFVDRINQIGTIKINFDAQDYNADLDQDKELQLFRAVNELINNTLKYGEAETINIVLSEKDNTIKLTFSDDGQGFDYDKIMNSNKAGIGLNNIIQRAKLAGGTAVIKSELGKGMSATISIKV